MHPVMLELVLISLDKGSVRCRVRSVPLLHGSGALRQVQAASGVPPEDAPRTLFHGTSWRQQDGVVYLTWVVGPDPDPSGEGVRILISNSAERVPGRLDDPSPDGVLLSQVAGHAVKHASWLARRDPEMFSDALDQNLWEAAMLLRPVRARGF